MTSHRIICMKNYNWKIMNSTLGLIHEITLSLWVVSGLCFSVNFCRADAHFPSTTVPGENLLFWFDAGHGVQTNGDGRVIHWENRLSNQKDLVKDDSKDGPEWKENVANGNPMLYFNRERQTCLRYPTPGAGDLCNGMTLFIVHKTMSTDDLQTYIGTSGKWTTNPGTSVHLFTGDGNFTYAICNRKYRTPSLKTAGGNAPLKIGSVQIHEILDNSGPYKLFTDGALTADFGGVKEDNKNFRGFCVGTWDGAWNDANKRFFEGYIGEILIYDKALSEEERGKVGRYLSEKWGIASSRYGFPEKRFEEDINIGEGERRTFASYGGWVSALTGGSGAGLVLDAPLTLETAGENVYAGSSGGPGGLTVRGSGSLIFSGTHAYKGSTVVDGGTLKVIGSLYAEGNSPVSTVTVRNGGVLEAGDGALGSFTTDSSSTFKVDGGILRLSGSGDLSSGEVAVSVGREGVTVDAIAGASLRLGTGEKTWTFDPLAPLTLSGEGNGVYSNGFMSLGPIVKTGSGEWTLAGKASGYSGCAPVRVKSGILKIAVEKDAASAVSAGDIDRPSLWFDASDPGSLTVENGHVTKWTSRGTMEGVFATGPVGPSVTRDIGALGTLRFSKDAQEYLRVENSPLHPADISIFVVYKIYSFGGPFGSILSSDKWEASTDGSVSMHLIIQGNTGSPQLSVRDAGDRLPTLTS